MKIIFESHATTVDNEQGIASGWNDAKLSKEGKMKAQELGERHEHQQIDAIFCADLQRGIDTARIAFPGVTPSKLFIDWRLRECDYGDLTQAPRHKIDPQKPQFINKPFPGGESYEDAMNRMKSFLDDLKKMKFKTVIIIGSRATHYGLDHWIKGISLDDLTATEFTWQPGWEYEL